jgi:hypothetical protein
MKQPAMIIPGAMEAPQSLAKAAEQSGVSKKTLDLAHLRASQINGCSVCVDMGLRFKKAAANRRSFVSSLQGKTRPISTMPNVQHSRLPKPSPD